MKDWLQYFSFFKFIPSTYLFRLILHDLIDLIEPIDQTRENMTFIIVIAIFLLLLLVSCWIWWPQIIVDIK